MSRRTLKDEKHQLFVTKSPFRPNFANRILSERERRIQYRIICHIDDSADKEFKALKITQFNLTKGAMLFLLAQDIEGL